MGAFARPEPIVLELTGADEERLLVLNDCTFCNRLMLLDGHPVKSCFHVIELLSDILLGYNLSDPCLHGGYLGRHPNHGRQMPSPRADVGKT